MVPIYFLAGWLTVTGVLQVIAAIRLRRHIKGEWILAVAGMLSILLGVGCALFPEAALSVMALWFGAYSISFGVLLLFWPSDFAAWSRTLRDQRQLPYRDSARYQRGGTSLSPIERIFKRRPV